MCNIESNQKEESTSSNNGSSCSKTSNPPRRSTPCYPLSPSSNLYQNNTNLNSSPVVIPNYDPHIRLPQLPIMPNISFNDSQSDRNCQSPLPRRKQVEYFYFLSVINASVFFTYRNVKFLE